MEVLAGKLISSLEQQDIRTEEETAMKRLGFIFALILLLPMAAVGAEQKIGYVNVSAIFEQYSAAKEAQQTYQKELEELNRQVTEMEQAIQALADTLNYKRYYFSEERLREKQQELEQRKKDYLDFRQKAEAKAAQRNDELSKPILNAIEEAIRKVAQKEGFDLVLDSGPGIVLYSKPELDLTDKVLQLLEESRSASE